MQNQRFSNQQIASYYNSTQNHYQRWWNLEDTLSVHYGIWNKDTSSFGESLLNTNLEMMSLAGVKNGDQVLDAGCGVGGSSFFLHNEMECTVQGITLSSKQLNLALQTKEKRSIKSVNFSIQDYNNTTFKDQSFDVVWACESVCHSEEKSHFLKEAFRVLKPGGRLIMADYFLPDEPVRDKNKWVEKWLELWGISKIVSGLKMVEKCEKEGFNQVKVVDYSSRIEKSAKRMYWASVMGALPSELYNLFNRGVSQFARHHYKSGIYQYEALKKGLWQYKLLVASKPIK